MKSVLVESIEEGLTQSQEYMFLYKERRDPVVGSQCQPKRSNVKR